MDAAASAMWMHFFPQTYIQTIKRKRGKRKDSRKTLEDTNRLQMEMSCSFFLPLIILSIFMMNVESCLGIFLIFRDT